METIQVQMLGEFTLRMGSRVLSATDCRSRKNCLLLAYLICNRNRVVPREELISLLWGEDKTLSDPEGVLRITMHRTRGLLQQLCPEGRSLILRRGGGYQWNGSTEVDVEAFAELCTSEAKTPAQRLSNLLRALECYQGKFLPQMTASPWINTRSLQLHNQFLSAAQEAVSLLEQQRRYWDAASVCRQVLTLEPYLEVFCQKQMQLLAAAGDRRGAAEVYEALSRRLFDTFGVYPSEETKSIYRIAAHSPEDRVLTMDEVMNAVQESDSPMGALLCDYDYFQVLCFAISRSMNRSGGIAHVVLIHVSGASSRQSLERYMGYLAEEIRLHLRRGDIFCRCSVYQYAIVLPGANYENSLAICQRLLHAFWRQHPSAPIEIQSDVRPLPCKPCCS